MKKYKIGYTTGVYDLFHIGHLNLLRNAKAECDYLIVGVTVDDLVSYKGRRAVIPFEERIQIVGAIRYVDEAVAQEDLDKVKAWERYHYDVLFVGDDWKGKPNWIAYEKALAEKNVDVVYLPYTKETSSTQLRDVLAKTAKEAT
jgi:glycerol-3-phosphate cytidylyltransferase